MKYNEIKKREVALVMEVVTGEGAIECTVRMEK
jgi:hypothetical protein